MGYANQRRSQRVVRDGEYVTRTEEERSLRAETPAVYPGDTMAEETVARRSLRSVDFSAATINSLLGVVLFALESLIATRFLLVLFGANRSSGFVDFIMNVSWPFVRPFSNAFANRTWDQGIIEPASLLAMGVYAIAFVLVMALVSTIVPSYIERRDVASTRTTDI